MTRWIPARRTLTAEMAGRMLDSTRTGLRENTGVALADGVGEGAETSRCGWRHGI